MLTETRLLPRKKNSMSMTATIAGMTVNVWGEYVAPIPVVTYGNLFDAMVDHGMMTGDENYREQSEILEYFLDKHCGVYRSWADDSWRFPIEAMEGVKEAKATGKNFVVLDYMS